MDCEIELIPEKNWIYSHSKQSYYLCRTCFAKRSREYRKEWRRNWTKEQRIARNESLRKYSANLKNQIFDILGRKCVRCGFSDERALQIDHVNDNGYGERKKYRASRNFYLHVLKKLKEGSKDYQTLCANCNWIKKLENENS
jgi:hypothetical protein